MRANLAALSLPLFLFATAASAQNLPQPNSLSSQPGYSAVNCSGFIADQKVPDEIRLISGEQSEYKVVFARGDKVFVNRGQDQGVRVGDRFMVVRHEKDILTDNVNWFKWQTKLLKQMGTSYVDAGQIRVINVQPKISVAEVIFSCDYMQRGDILRPYVDRPSPPYKDAATFDHFAPVSGKPVGTLVGGFDNADSYGQNSTVFINLGAAQGLKVGDYVRVFRHQGEPRESTPQTAGYQYMLYGFGSTPAKYSWKDLPRELLGEGIVLNVSRNSATVLITYSTLEMYAGDYAEIE
jgi:ribosomal protein L24